MDKIKQDKNYLNSTFIEMKLNNSSSKINTLCFDSNIFLNKGLIIDVLNKTISINNYFKKIIYEIDNMALPFKKVITKKQKKK